MVIVPEIRSMPPRPVERVKVVPVQPIEIPQATVETEWEDVSEFEMPIRGKRRRHLVMPTSDTFERQMRHLNQDLNDKRMRREEGMAWRPRARAYELMYNRDASIEVERRARAHRHRSMPPLPMASDIMVRSRTPETLRTARPPLAVVAPLPPSKMDSWHLLFRKQAEKALREPTALYTDRSTPLRKQVSQPSRLWLPSNEYHAIADDESKFMAPQPISLPRPTPAEDIDTEDERLRILRDDIELSRRRRMQIKEQRMKNLKSEPTSEDIRRLKQADFEIERSRRLDRITSLPPPRRTAVDHTVFRMDVSPLRRLSPSPSPAPSRRPPAVRRPASRLRGVSMPPIDTQRPRHAPHLPIQPSKFWVPSRQWRDITRPEGPRALSPEPAESDRMHKLMEEFERDRLRRQENRLRHERELADTRDTGDEYIVRRRQARQVSMPPMPRSDIIRPEHIPKAYAPRRSISPPAYKPAARDASQQEIEIETIAKRINENIEEYEDSLKRRPHYTVPVRKVVTPLPVKKRQRTRWAALYTTVAQKIEETESSEEEEEDWITIRKKRSKRHLVLPSSEISRTVRMQTEPMPHVIVSERNRLSKSDARHQRYNIVSIHDDVTQHKMQLPPKPHFTEEAEFDSGWHAVTPHVHETRHTHDRVHVTKRREAPLRSAPAYDKRTPAADSWMRTKHYPTTRSDDSVSSVVSGRSVGMKSGRHLITPDFVPKRMPMRKAEPISVLMLEKKHHHVRHEHEDMEAEPEPVFRRRRVRRSRHNLAVPAWDPSQHFTSERSSRRETPPRAQSCMPSVTSYHRERSYTPLDEPRYTSPSPARPSVRSRRASVGYIPGSPGGQSSRSLASSTSSLSNVSEYSIRPMRDIFSTAVQRVREQLPWRQVYNEAVSGRTSVGECCLDCVVAVRLTMESK